LLREVSVESTGGYVLEDSIPQKLEPFVRTNAECVAAVDH